MRSIPPVKAETSPIESSITLNLEEDIPGTPLIPDQRSESNRPPPSTSKQSERPAPSLRRVRKTSIATGKTQRCESSMTSHPSSTSDSSDSSDDTWTGPSCTPVWGGPRKKAKRARRCRSDHTTSQWGFDRASTEVSGRSRCPYDLGPRRPTREVVSTSVEEKMPTRAVAKTNTLVHIKAPISMSFQ